MAIDLGTTVEGERGGETVELTSADIAGTATVPLDVADPQETVPAWARYVAGVVSVVRPAAGFRGKVSTTLPVGSGLSSSAALEVAGGPAPGFVGLPPGRGPGCPQGGAPGRRGAPGRSGHPAAAGGGG